MKLFLLCVLCVGGAVSAVITMEQNAVPWQPQADMNLFELAKSEHLWAFLTLTDTVNYTSLMSEPGSYTMFVPSDSAIQDYLSPQYQEMLTKNMTLLKEALGYHAVNGLEKSSDLKDNQVLNTMAGFPLRVNKMTKADGTMSLSVNGATVTKSDQTATNGIIHEINQFIFPIPRVDMGTLMKTTPKEYSMIYNLLDKAQMLTTLSSGTYTLFAPNNMALQRISKTLMNKLESDMDLLKRVLSYHLLSGARFASSLPQGTPGWIKTVEGDQVVVMVPGMGPIGPSENVVMINDCQGQMRQGVTNGVMFEIMCLLLPPGVM